VFIFPGGSLKGSSGKVEEILNEINLKRSREIPKMRNKIFPPDIS
jgi:hypothetical protein